MFNSLLKLTLGASLVASTAAAPNLLVERALVPSGDGFPTPNAQQLISISRDAHGTLTNGPRPAPGALNNDTLISLRLIAFNELFETAFFNSVLFNVTNNVTGFVLADPGYRSFVIKSLNTIIAQEKLHAVNAQNGLRSQNATTIEPCTNYIFPTTTFEGALLLAQTFTDVVLGTLQDVVRRAAIAGAFALTQGVASTIGQEGQQSGAYRLLQRKVPSAQPFLTSGARPYAWSALQGFVAPGSCPSSSQISLPIFAPLTVLGTPVVNATDLRYSFDVSRIATAKLVNTPNWSASTNFSQVASVVYINGQNVPFTVPITNYTVAGTVVTISAPFPFQQNLLWGLTLSAIVNGTGPFASIDAAANQTVFGPGLIEIE